MKNLLKVKPLIEKHLLKDGKGTGKLNLYRRTNDLGETEYIYQETPDSEEILLTPTNKRFSDDPTNWDYKDANGREYSPRMTKPAVAQAELRPYEKDWYRKMTEALGYDWLVNKSNKYYNNPILGAPARWAASYDNNTNPIKGLWNSPLAYSNIYSMAAKAADNLFLNPNGLQKTIALYNNSDGSPANRYAWQKSLLGDVLEASMISPAAREAYQSGKNVLSDIYNLYKNYPIRQYNIESILKSDFYKNLSEQYGKEFADDFALKITSQDFREYFFGNNPRLAIKEGNRHAKQMLIIKDVEDSGGILSGSGLLARNGTVHREGLLHDLDFNIPGNIEEGRPSLDSNLGFTPYYYQKRPVWTTGTVPINTNEFSVQQGYVNVPMKRDGIVSDMFVRKQIPNRNEIVDVILDAKRRWGRPKDLADIEAFTPYSSENPVINLATGEGQWNPTLFDKGIFTSEGYPYILEVELYPGSGIKIPVVMNSKGQIRSVIDNTGIPEGLLSKEPLVAKGVPQITAENAASITPEQWTAAQDAAITRGDMVEAQRLRDLHSNIAAEKEGFTAYNTYRSQKPNNKYKWENKSPYDDSRYGIGKSSGYFSIDSEPVARTYKYTDDSPLFNLNIYMKNPYIKDVKGRSWQFVDTRIAPNGAKYGVTTDEIVNKVKPEGVYDGVIFKNIVDVGAFRRNLNGASDVATDYVSFPGRAKLRDAVTYDDNGVRIPLGERDNFNINDIRYGLLPFGMGLTGYRLYNRKQGGKMFKFKKGNKIHIKKANRGKFTDYCGGEVTNECILRGKHSSNPAVRKRATFAANARKWKHKEGGILKGQGGLIFPKSTAYSEIPKKLEISRVLFNRLSSMPLDFRKNVARLNLYNRFDPSIKDPNLRLEKGITRSFNAAKKSLINWYLSDDYARRLNRARQTSWLPSFVLQSNDKIVSNLVDRVNNVSLDFDSGNMSGTNGMPGSTYNAVTVPDEHKIYFNRNQYNRIRLFPGNIFGTSSHELSHDSDRVLPRFALNYNHSLIKLNPNLSADVRAYYGDDSEIRARAVDTITNFNELRNKYKSLDEFVDKNLNTIRGLKQLSNTFDSKESMMNYLKNFVYNDNSTNDYSNLNDDGVLYSKQGGIVKADDGVKFTLNDGINLGLNLYGTTKYNSAIDNQIKALNPLKDYYKNSIISKKYKDNIMKGFAERLQLPNSGTVINSNPDIDKHFYYTQAVNDSLDELNEINRSLELLKLNLQAQKKSILSSAANTALNYNNYDFG